MTLLALLVILLLKSCKLYIKCVFWWIEMSQYVTELATRWLINYTPDYACMISTSTQRVVKNKSSIWDAVWSPLVLIYF